jgi:hypothetical protein
MADGTHKAIREVKVGDQVLATEPLTGQTVARTVQAVLRHYDTDLADLTIVDGSGATAIVHTTAHHPFWDATRRQWLDAAALPATDQLGIEGQLVRVVRVDERFGVQAMYDLTVETTHTYDVLAGVKPLLVHNCDGVDPIARSVADHANGEALRPDGNGTHFVRGVHPDQMAYYVDGVINGRVPNVEVKYGLSNGREAYWDPDKGALIIIDGEGGTVFTPKNGYSDFTDLR